MAHLLAPQPTDPELPTFFNVNGVVGAQPAQNNQEDVTLVQFYFKLIADNPRPTSRPATIAAARQVRVTGTIDQATIQAIRVFQDGRGPGHVVDGRVSPVKGGGYDYGSGFFTIVLLNESIQHRQIDIWPRLDRIAGCPQLIAAMVKRTVVGV